MTEPAWISERDALAIHARLLRLDGGTPGLRDAGVLASALARPLQHRERGDEPDLVRLAALYTDATIRNHPFVDGNKRVGFVIGVLFLKLHGFAFTAPQPLATHAVLYLAARRTGLDDYERLLRDLVRSPSTDH
ncbi:MAG TPA: type II toxin-antitoxin system death-on-curing family toxin [Trueperaceae bacterium]|nr:type II toxin-antitoxin system death-on-curing family toxin [Trueperaceae bacterium]